MTVEELIKALQEHPPDMHVYVDGYEGGIDDVEGVTVVQVHRDVHTASYYGQHEADPDDPRGKPLEPGLLLRSVP